MRIRAEEKREEWRVRGARRFGRGAKVGSGLLDQSVG